MSDDGMKNWPPGWPLPEVEAAVVLFRDPIATDWWVAQLLPGDMAAQGRTQEEALDEMARMLRVRKAAIEQEGAKGRTFGPLPEAPECCWRLPPRRGEEDERG